MTEEEFFIKNYPDFCYGDKPLSPHWDLFQYGVEFGERESEKKIQELEQENKVLAQNLEDTEIVNKALEKENAELKEKVNILDNCDRLGDVITEAYKEQLTKAKELLNEFLDFESSCMERGIYISDKIRTEAEQFISEVEK